MVWHAEVMLAFAFFNCLSKLIYMRKCICTHNLALLIDGLSERKVLKSTGESLAFLLGFKHLTV